MSSFPALDLSWRSGRDTAELVELLYAQLDEFAPQAIHDHETGDGWRVFFRTDTQRDGARDRLSGSLGDRLVSVFAVDVADEEWARRSQENLTAIRVGRIIVTPPWLDQSRDSRIPPRDSPPFANPVADLVIVIDPSTGFGTGHHETTRLCLALLQDIEVAGRRVIDVGTGLGVLAIAAAALGAASVVAFDEDPEALRNARENVERNRVATKVDVREATLAAFQAHSAQDQSADVVVANLTGAVIQKHASALAALVRPGGRLIVSGFNLADANDVARACGHSVEREVAEGEWGAVVFRTTPGGG